jgi:predicted transposase YdaD
VVRGDAELTARAKADLLDSMGILLGLRYNASQTTQLMRAIMDLRESTLYQHLFETGEKKGRDEGRIEGELQATRRLILKLAATRLGTASTKSKKALDAIDSLARLERMVERIGDATDWDDLLATP